MSRPKVLVVDDETGVLSACARALRRVEADIVTSDSPMRGLEMTHADEFAVIVSDQRMPEMSGAQFLEQISHTSPDTVRVILTGYADINLAMDAINRAGVSRYLTKPWNDDDLRCVVTQGLEQFALVRENRRLQELTRQQNEELLQLNATLEQRVEERTADINRLNTDLRNSLLGSIRVLAELTEMHSKVIGSHGQRVAGICRRLAALLNISGGDLVQLEIAAILHDIGKIGIPAEIARKRDAALTAQERAVMELHPARGDGIVRMVPNLAMAATLVRHHHERLDGRGYPDRLVGDQIPLGSRIIAVASAYDNILNSREHFENVTPAQALHVVEQLAPGRFDPVVMEALQRYVSTEADSIQQGAEIEIRLRDLRVGMMLSRELRTSRGVLLLPKNCVMNAEHLSRVKAFQQSEPIVDRAYVFRPAVNNAQP
ncbi:MAG: response regulator [Planctomycetaceae bacterium]|nr:response regulator [Planctomycetaceae bacterium]